MASPEHPFTLAVDIGGTGLKASVLDADGLMVADRVRIPTAYPLPPDKLVADLTGWWPRCRRPSGLRSGFRAWSATARSCPLPHFSPRRARAARSTRTWPTCGTRSTWPPR